MYNISAVTQRTGVQAVTLRAWERRYGLLKPQRSDNGHRSYTEVDIERINQIVNYTKAGVPVSKVKKLLEPEQHHLIDTEHYNAWQDYLSRMIANIEIFDQKKLDAVYNDVLSLYPIEIVTENLLLPLLNQLGERWQVKYQGAIAEEHFFSTFMRNKLGSRFNHMVTHTHGKKLVFACLPNYHHEFALLLFAIHVLSRGYQVIFLGANTPVAEIFIAASRCAADAVVLDGKHDDKLVKELTKATKNNDVKVFMHDKKLKGSLPGILKLTDDFTESLQIIEKIINSNFEE